MYRRVLTALCLCILFAPAAPAAEVRRELSLQGMTGLLNTPNALVTETGRVELGYSNQVEGRWRDQVPWQDNYLLSFGLLPFLEAGARLTEASGGVRDLSAAAKFQLPFLPAGWPRLAAGIQDLGGGAPHFRSRYLVASQEPFSWLRLSLGYGFGPDRLKGVFGGGEVQVTDWLQLVGEHDGREAAAGLRISTPEKLFPWPLRLGLTLKSSLADRHGVDLGLNLSLPLGRDPGASYCSPQRIMPVSAPALAASVPAPPPAAAENPLPTAGDPALLRLQKLLVEEGFESVRVGLRDGRTLVVEFENSRFNRNEVDALGLVLGTALGTAPAGIEGFALRLLNGGLAVVELRGPFRPFRDAFLAPACLPPGELQALQTRLRAEVAPAAPSKEETWVGAAGNPRFLHGTLVLAPGLATAVGTDFGVFDYRLSLRPDAYLQLWPGANFRLLADIPLAWSDDYASGARFNAGGENDPTLERILLNQAGHPGRGILTLFSVGQFRKDLLGGLNETIWSTPGGRHQLRVKAALFDDRNDGRQRSSLLGTYRYDWPEADIQVEGTVGRFFGGDKGFVIEVRRFFADTAVGFFYSDTDVRIGGVRISLPLTPRRDMAPAPVQLRGTEQWDYRLQSVLTDSGGRNPLVFDSGVLPQTEYTLERDFLNRDRFSEAYLRAHLPRMLEAYRRYQRGKEQGIAHPGPSRRSSGFNGAGLLRLESKL